MAIISSPVQIGSLVEWAQASTNDYVSTAIKSDNTLWTWGINADGQLGLGDTIERSSPVQVGSLTNWVQVACGYHSVWATKTNGTLWAWGLNDIGQLSNGNTTSLSSPVQVGALLDWLQISADHKTLLSIKADNTLWALGENTYGQLGIGNTISKSSPVQVGSLTDWSLVECGKNFAMAIKYDTPAPDSGTLWAWGLNTSGQLGLSDTFDRLTPNQVGSLHDWMQVSCGSLNTLAVKRDGTLWAWGANHYGQLGVGTSGALASTLSPVQVGSDVDWAMVACGNAPLLDTGGISVAIKTDGTLWAWGYNLTGGLGLSDLKNRSVPVQVGTYNIWRSVAVSNTGKIIALSANFIPPIPSVGVKSGKVNTFVKTNGIAVDNFTQSTTIIPHAANTLEFGYTTDLSGGTLIVGAPGSGYNNGYVYVYKNISEYNEMQIIAGNTNILTNYITSNVNPLPTARLGTSVAIDSDEQWLYIGAPGEDKVYVYGKDQSIPYARTIMPLATQSILLTFTPALANQANALHVSSSVRSYVPDVDFTLNNKLLTFIQPINTAVLETVTVIQQPQYRLFEVITGPAKSNFGYSIDISSDNTQLVIGAPTYTKQHSDVAFGNLTISGTVSLTGGNVATGTVTVSGYANVGTGNISSTISSTIFTHIAVGGNVSLGYATVNSNVSIVNTSITGTLPVIGNIAVTNYNANASTATLSGTISTTNTVTVIDAASSGSAYIYSRIVEAKISNGTQEFTTTNAMGPTYKVIINNQVVNNYNVVDSHTLQFISAPVTGTIVYIQTSALKLTETVVSDVIQRNAQFGTSVAIAPDSSAIYIGAPLHDFNNIYNTGAVFSYNNICNLYGTITGNKRNPTFYVGNSLLINNREIFVTNPLNDLSQLDSFIVDINDAKIVGVTAINVGGYLQISTNTKLTKNQLSIHPGYTANSTPDVLTSAGFVIYNKVQTIVNPYLTPGEYFGNKVAIDSETDVLVIASDRGTTKSYTTFDDGITIFDSGTTGIYASILGSGAVYTFDLFNDPRNSILHPGGYAFSQQLNPGELNTNDQFGHAIDISGNYIIASAPKDDTMHVIVVDKLLTFAKGDKITQVNNDSALFVVAIEDTYANRIVAKNINGTSLDFSNLLEVNGVLTDAIPTDVEINTGSVYIFKNPNTLNRGWTLLRSQQPTVDIDSMNQMYLYSKQSNTVLSHLEFIDPIKGKILGQAEQEISYKTDYDPAEYNRGTNVTVNINSNLYWGPERIEKVWWNLSLVRFIDYEQDTLAYRSLNWGRVFPGSTIEILEWVESDTPPSRYTGGGVPKYADDSAYVELPYVNPVTKIITNKYYFWVKNKTSVTGINPARKLPIAAIANMIENPKSQGISYAAITSNSSIITYNISGELSADDTVLHINHQKIKNANVIHSEYDLIEEGNAVSAIPAKIVTKLIDSLSGVNATGQIVPDPSLSPANKLGIGFRPRQSMFINRFGALTELVSYVNSVLIQYPITKQYDLTLMNSAEVAPSSKTNSFSLEVNNDTELTYVDTKTLAAGYLVLVNNDSTQHNLWTIYKLSTTRTWELVRIQRYNTTRYWDYIDYYADGYSIGTQPTFVAPTLVDALKLSYAPGNLIKILNTGNGQWELVLVNSSGGFDVIGIQNGTIALKTSLGVDNGNLNPTTELRNIIIALQTVIFKGELDAEFNKLFFVLINYIFSEQKYVDWIFKTSFISVLHQLRTLDQTPSYIRDNQSYFQEYLEEVKPYKTKVREYVTSYKGVDNFEGSVTDFDLPAYYDTNAALFRSPSGEYVENDERTWQQEPYSSWYNNRNYEVSSIILENPGAGYTSVPIITFVGGGPDVIHATATATIDFDLGIITGIVLNTAGSGYNSRPTVIINGGSTTPATGYAVLKNYQVRSFATTIKYDRIGYTSTVQEWQPDATYLAGDIISYSGIGYEVISNITTGDHFLSTDYKLYPAANFTNANDRIMAYYAPSNTMPAKKLSQLLPGITYPGVQVKGLTYDQQPGFDMSPFDSALFDALEYDADGNPILSNTVLDNIITSRYNDAALGTRAEDIIVDGGLYVDAYSSHSPEELVPGITFDTLSMQVFTKVNSGVDVLGYRIFNNMLNNTTYLRISDRYSTILMSDLHYNDTQIFVADTAKLFVPIPSMNKPGVIFVNNERITYYTIDLNNNVLGQIRRGTEGTGVSAIHRAGTLVVDGSARQLVPVTAGTSSTTLVSDVTYSSTRPPYYIKTSRQFNANIGDIITQPLSGANVMVVGKDLVGTDRVLVSYNSNEFIFSTFAVELNQLIPREINIGDTIYQPLTGANLSIVQVPAIGSSIVQAYYQNTNTLQFGRGNLIIAGQTVDIYPVIEVNMSTTNYALYINGLTTGNIYPLASTIAGALDDYGNVTVSAGTTIYNSNVWYNVGISTATDGTGFEGAITPEVLFLKDAVAHFTIGFESEDAVNIIYTEDQIILVEE